MNNSNDPGHRNPGGPAQAMPAEAPADRKPDVPAEPQKKEAVEPTRVVPANDSRDSRR